MDLLYSLERHTYQIRGLLLKKKKKKRFAPPVHLQDGPLENTYTPHLQYLGLWTTEQTTKKIVLGKLVSVWSPLGTSEEKRTECL